MLTVAATAADEKKPDPAETKEIAYVSVNLADQPLVLALESGERKTSHVSIYGTLGGKGYLGLDGNSGVFSVFGDAVYLADGVYRAWQVQLKPLAIQDPQNRKRRIFEITGAPIKGVSLRLVVPAQPSDSPRLLIVSGKNGDTIQRAITLENQSK